MNTDSTPSLGATIACAMELFEAGYMTEEDTGGIPVRFGDAATMVKLAEMTGKNE